MNMFNPVKKYKRAFRGVQDALSNPMSNFAVGGVGEVGSFDRPANPTQVGGVPMFAPPPENSSMFATPPEDPSMQIQLKGTLPDSSVLSPEQQKQLGDMAASLDPKNFTLPEIESETLKKPTLDKITGTLSALRGLSEAGLAAREEAENLNLALPEQVDTADDPNLRQTKEVVRDRIRDPQFGRLDQRALERLRQQYGRFG
tara:strand:- start:104 stop:706 length:603 start_codon:yes stop_codon:yes gene_type:complete